MMVDSAVVARGGLLKRRSIEKPRPLRCDPERICLDEITRLVDEVTVGLAEAKTDLRTRQKTQQLKDLLRMNGGAMERFHKDVLDKLELVLREVSYDTEMDVLARLNVLEILEMRIEGWSSSSPTSSMYKQRMAEAQLNIDMRKIGYEGGLNVMDEGRSEEEEARRNGRGDDGDIILQLLNTDNNHQEKPNYTSEITVNGVKIHVSSSSKQFVVTSKEVLQEFFSIVQEEDQASKIVKPKICYEKDELLRLSRSPLCKAAPLGWESIVTENPFIVRKEEKEEVPPPAKHFLRGVEGIIKQEAARKM